MNNHENQEALNALRVINTAFPSGWTVKQFGGFLSARGPDDRSFNLCIYRHDWIAIGRRGRGAGNNRRAFGNFGDGVGETPFGELPAAALALVEWVKGNTESA